MKVNKMFRILAAAMVVAVLCCVPAFAAGDVASAVESTWNDAAAQIKTVVEMWCSPRWTWFSPSPSSRNWGWRILITGSTVSLSGPAR